MSILTSNIKVTKIVQKHFLCTYWGFLVTIICDVKIDINMCEPHYVNFFFVNLFHSPCIWLFDIWHIFDNLTSFWQLDIFFDIWAIGHMGNGTHEQRSIMVNIEDRDRIPWGMGYMGGAHDQHFLNTAWIFTKILLDIDIDVFCLNIQCYSHDGLI